MGFLDRAFPKAPDGGGAPRSGNATVPFAPVAPGHSSGGGAPPEAGWTATPGRGAAPGGPGAASAPSNGHPAPLPPGGGSPVAPSDLLDRRMRLAEQLAELQWDLGGLAYEMAIRDHFRLDVIVRRAATLQQVDAELAEVEHILRLEQAGAAGSCPTCGALHPRGAAFCGRCGNQLLEVITPA